jgi:alkylhydroperoxidase family enzyme
MRPVIGRQSSIARPDTPTRHCHNHISAPNLTAGGTDMARIPILHEDDPAIPPDSRLYLQQAGQSRGRLLNIYRAMANRPQTGRAFSALANTVYRGTTTLDPKHAELAYLTATVVNNCYY